MHLVIYGPEGSGKGTQAAYLSRHFHLPIFTAGDLVREAAKKNNSEIGKAARFALNSGTYVSDIIMFKLATDKLNGNEAKKGFILDGFPRNVNQAKFLLKIITSAGYKIDKVIYLKLTDVESQKRLLLRKRKLFRGSSLSHDTPILIRKRLTTYREREHKLLQFFKSAKLLLQVNADDTRENVFKSIIKKLPQASANEI